MFVRTYASCTMCFTTINAHGAIFHLLLLFTNQRGMITFLHFVFLFRNHLKFHSSFIHSRPMHQCTVLRETITHCPGFCVFFFSLREYTIFFISVSHSREEKKIHKRKKLFFFSIFESIYYR